MDSLTDLLIYSLGGYVVNRAVAYLHSRAALNKRAEEVSEACCGKVLFASVLQEGLLQGLAAGIGWTPNALGSAQEESETASSGNLLASSQAGGSRAVSVPSGQGPHLPGADLLVPFCPSAVSEPGDLLGMHSCLLHALPALGLHDWQLGQRPSLAAQIVPARSLRLHWASRTS